MKYTKFIINPIPKWNIDRSNNAWLSIFTLIIALIFCNHVKAIPEDWPSHDRMEVCEFNEWNTSAFALACRGSIQVSLDQAGRATITAKMLISDILPSYAQFKVYVNETGLNYVTCADIGKNRTATVLDTTTGMSCWSLLVVEDKLKPIILCRKDTVSCNEDPFALDYTQFASATDNCDANVDIVYDLRFEKLSCDPSFISVSHIIWTATDNYGNKSTCSNDIYFQRTPIDSVVFPLNDTLYCPNADINDAGVPTYHGFPLDPYCELFVTHQEDTIPVCGGMIKITRHWTVIDWCTRISRMQNQIVTIADTTRPIIICPGDTSLFTSYTACNTNYLIPMVQATDNCSPPELMYYLVRIDSSILAHPGNMVTLDVGNHTFQYIAIDPCGNSDTCISFVTVIDQIAPTIICPPKLALSLDAIGQVLLTAAYFEKIGFIIDNCEIDTILIRRMDNACNRPQDTVFRDEVTFCCSDIGTRVMLVVKVQDIHGNMNFCMIEMDVQDKNTVALLCPSNITISCTLDYTDLNVTGKFNVKEVCTGSSGVIITHSDSGKLDSCKRGIIYRKFFVKYTSGLIDSSCRQQITVVNNYSFNANDIIWARDTMIRACTSNHPDSLRSSPTNPKDSCGTIAYTFRDSLLSRPPDSCRRILRLWLARSLCNNGSARDTQIINVSDFAAPRLRVPRDTIVSSTQFECNPVVTLMAASVTSCNTIISFVNSYNGGGANASGRYPLGVTNVVFTVTDICGNITTGVTKVTMDDPVSPQATCVRPFVSKNFGTSDSVKITARELLASYTDNCTPNDKLRISFDFANPNDTCRFLTCTQFKLKPDSIYNFNVFIKDSSSNTASCVGMVRLFDPTTHCGTLLQNTVVVSGLIKSVNQSPMAQVEIEAVELRDSVMSNDKGNYEFNKVPIHSKLTLRPKHHNDNWLEGVTTQDIVYIQKQILGIQSFLKPEQWIAADINNDGFVTSGDVVWLRKLILGKVNQVPNNNSWRFVHDSYVFKDLNNPLSDSFAEQFTNPKITEATQINFKAIKIGDVTSATGVIHEQVGSRLKYYELTVDDQELPEAIRSHSEFKINQDLTIEGFQMNITFDSELALIDHIDEFLTDAGGIRMDESNYIVEDGQLRISFNLNFPKRVNQGDRMFRIVWQNVKNSNLKDLLHDTQYKNNEIYLTNSLASPLAIRILPNTSSTSLEISDWFVKPNPFKDRCRFEFESSIGMDALIEMFTQDGKSVISEWRSVEKGYNNWEFDRSLFPIEGSYYFKAQFGSIKKQGKLIIIH